MPQAMRYYKVNIRGTEYRVKAHGRQQAKDRAVDNYIDEHLGSISKGRTSGSIHDFLQKSAVVYPD